MARFPHFIDHQYNYGISTVTSRSVVIPSTWQDGDFILGVFRVSENPGTVTYPAYITNLVADATFTVGTNDSRIRLFYFRRDSVAQGSTFTISWTTAQYALLNLMCIRGVDVTTPFATTPASGQQTGSVSAPNTIPYSGISVSDGELACLIACCQSDATDEPLIGTPQTGPFVNGGDYQNKLYFDSMSNPDYYMEARMYARLTRTGETSLASGTISTSTVFGTAAATYYTWVFALNPAPLSITDVDGDETWNDGDTGLIVTGTGLGV